MCVTTWRSKILATLPNIDLNLIIGRYAIDWHAPEHSKSSVSEAAKDWKAHWPHRLILPHPSPRKNRWLKTNPWFEGEIVPQLYQTPYLDSSAFPASLADQQNHCQFNRPAGVENRAPQALFWQTILPFATHRANRQRFF